MNNIIEKEDQDTAKAVRHSRLGKFWKPLASAAVAAVAAVSMGMSAGAATAAPTEISGYHHVDYVSVNYDENNDAIELGSNLNDTEWVPTGTYSIKVPWSSPVTASDTEGTGYVLPGLQANAISRNIPWVGFSGDASLRDILSSSNGDSVTVELAKAAFTPKPGSSNTSGAVTASQSGQTWFSAAGKATNLTVSAKSHTFPVTDTEDEVFHEHTRWVFSQPGTYVLTFKAETNNGYVADLPSYTYTFNVGL